MKKITLFILFVGIILFFSSCGAIQKITNSVFKKTSQTVKTNSEKKTDSTGTVKTTVAEKLDSNLNIKGDSVKKTEKITDLQKGKDIHLDNGKTIIDVHFDKETGNVIGTATTKPRTERLQIDRTTTTEQTSHVNTATKTAIKQTTKETDKSKTIEVIKKGFWESLPWYVYLLVILLLAGLAYYLLRKYSK